jgi:hypothetical protein
MINICNMLVGMTMIDRFWNANIWYALPAIIAISFVYAATRHEAIVPILGHAIRTVLWISGFMAGFFLLLWLSS